MSRLYMRLENETIEDVLKQIKEYFSEPEELKGVDGKLAYFDENLFNEFMDYITNLQEELEEEKRIEQADFKTIQNLEEENEKLKQWDCNKDSRNSRQRVEINRLYKQREKFMKKYGYLKEENKSLKELNVCVGCNNNPDYKSRNEKAIKDMKNFIEKNYNNEYLDLSIINYWLNILNGGDEE